MTGKNQVTIPMSLANETGIRRGTRLEWRKADRPDELVVRILPDHATVARSLRGSGRGHLAQDADPIAALVRDRETESD